MTQSKKRGSPSRTPTSAPTSSVAKPSKPAKTPPVAPAAKPTVPPKAAVPPKTGSPKKASAAPTKPAPISKPGADGKALGGATAAPKRAMPKPTAAPAPSAKAPGAGRKAPAAAEGPAKPAAPTPRTWPKGGPSKADLKRYREALVARRRELLSSSKELAAEALQAGGGDFSVDHMADHGSDNYEQDFNLKLLEGEAGQLTDIRDALAKLDGKADLPFGLCEGCADEPQGRCPSCPWIPASRLDAIPQARLCVQMKEREESRG